VRVGAKRFAELKALLAGLGAVIRSASLEGQNDVRLKPDAT
jgi:hypothetical protein